MSVLLIPTRNRPASLEAVLRYISTFFPERKIFIADGSSTHYSEKIFQVVKLYSDKLEITYKNYNPKLPFFERILDALDSIDTDIVTMGADDDFPQFDVIDEAENALIKNPNAVVAMGATLHLNMYNEQLMRARLDHAHPVLSPSAASRANQFAKWPFSTTYAPTRKEHLKERYNRALTSFLPGFYDFKTGVHDAISGGIIVVPGLSFVATRNYVHSYLRAEDDLIFLRKSDEVLQLRKQFELDLIAADVEKKNAEKIATRLIRAQIATLAGRPPHKLSDFYDSQQYKNKLVIKQFELFSELFSDQKKPSQLFERLCFIRDSLKLVATSHDNLGELPTYETLAEQSLASNQANSELIETSSVGAKDSQKIPADNEVAFMVNIDNLSRVSQA